MQASFTPTTTLPERMRNDIMNKTNRVNINSPHRRGRKSRSKYASAALCTAAVAIALCAAAIRIQKDNSVPTDSVSSDTSSQAMQSNTQSDMPSVTSEDDDLSQPVAASPNQSVSSTPSADEYEDFEDSEQTLAIQTLAGTGEYVRAVGGAITKDYNMSELVYSRTMGDWRVHNGVDLSATKGEAVKSAGEGTVAGIINDTMYGTTVVVNQNDGLMVYYRGMSSNVAVKEGENISAGTTLGTVGEIPCENGDGSHLHLEVMRNNDHIDPAEAFGYK